MTHPYSTVIFEVFPFDQIANVGVSCLAKNILSNAVLRVTCKIFQALALLCYFVFQFYKHVRGPCDLRSQRSCKCCGTKRQFRQ